LQERAARFFSTFEYLAGLIKPDKIDEIKDGLVLVVTHMSNKRTIDQVRKQN
jgi:hypothetical protein